MSFTSDKIVDPFWDTTSLFISMLKKSSSSEKITCEKGTTLSLNNVSFSTTQFKQISSGFFDGTSSFILTDASPITSEDFTVEGWIYHSARSALGSVIFSQDFLGTSSSCSFYIDSSGSLVFVWNTSLSLTSSSTIPLDTWTYVTLQRMSGTLSIWINGILSSSNLITGSLTSDKIIIGAGRNTTLIGILKDLSLPLSGYFSGYMSHLRITKSGRYSSSFNPFDHSLNLFTDVSGILYLGGITNPPSIPVTEVELFDRESNLTFRTLSDGLGNFSFSGIYTGKDTFLYTTLPLWKNSITPVFLFSTNLLYLTSSESEIVISDPSDFVLFTGTAFQKNGQPVPFVTLLNYPYGEYLETTSTDSSGHFSFYLLRGNEYIIVFIGEIPYRPRAFYYQA